MYNLATSFFKEDISRFVLDFVGGGGELNNKILFFLMCSEIGVDRSTSKVKIIHGSTFIKKCFGQDQSLYKVSHLYHHNT